MADQAQSSAKPHRHTWRSWVPWVLVVLAAVIGLVASLNIWVKRQALNSDNWANTSSQLLENDQIRSALSVFLVDQVFQNVDAKKALEEKLPPRAKGLAAPLAAGLQSAAVRGADNLLARPKAQKLWKEANRRADKGLIALLEGKNGVLVSTNGNVVLDLRPVVARLGEKTGLGTKLEQKLPPDAGQIVIMKKSHLQTARSIVKVIRFLSFFLAFLMLALYALAVYLARGRRRNVLMGVGVSVLVVGLLILVVRRFAGNYLVDALTSNPDSKDAVSAAWGIGTELLRNVGVNGVIYGVGIVFAAWVAGPSRPATWSRRVLAPTMRDHAWVIYGAVTLALILVLLAGPTDAQRIFPLLILFAFAYAGTEVLRRQTLREFPESASARTPAT